MSRSLIAALAVGVGAILAMVPAQAGVAPDDRYVDAVVDAWRAGLVYVDRTQHLLMTEDDAARLAERTRGHDPAIRIAVVPAVALSTMPGASDDQRGVAFVQQAVDRFGSDGHYLVVFGGTGTYSGSVGVSPPADVALEGQLDNFTRGEPAALLHAVLDELGVPELPEEAGSSGLSPLVFIVGGVTVAAMTAGGLLWWRSRRSADHGPALYRPSFEVLPDELDTLEERRKLAREDVTRFGEVISAGDLPLDDPAVAADVQAAMDAYSEVGSAVDDEPDDLVLQAVRATSEYGRWRLACARARLDGQPLPPRRADCFELCDDGRAALRGQRQLGPPLLRPGALLGQAHRLRDGPGLEGDLRVRLAPPPRQRGVQVGDRPRGVGPRQLLRGLQVGREGVRVQGVGRQPQRSRAAR